MKNRNTRNGWATPAVVEHEGTTQVITTASRPDAGNRNSPGKVISYDLENGKRHLGMFGPDGQCDSLSDR